jgi:hypothetical protein
LKLRDSIAEPVLDFVKEGHDHFIVGKAAFRLRL